MSKMVLVMKKGVEFAYPKSFKENPVPCTCHANSPRCPDFERSDPSLSPLDVLKVDAQV